MEVSYGSGAAGIKMSRNERGMDWYDITVWPDTALDIDGRRTNMVCNFREETVQKGVVEFVDFITKSEPTAWIL